MKLVILHLIAAAASNGVLLALALALALPGCKILGDHEAVQICGPLPPAQRCECYDRVHDLLDGLNDGSEVERLEAECRRASPLAEAPDAG